MIQKIQTGEVPIKWLTDEQIRVFGSFSWLVAVGEWFWRERKILKTSTYFWIANNTIMFFAMLFTTYHYIDYFPMLAYSAHHSTLLFADAVIPLVFYANRRKCRYIVERSKYSYEYGSELMSAFAKELLAKRTVQMRRISWLMQFITFSILFVVEAFFLLEVLLLKNYKTVFPFYIGMDLDDPVVYCLVISWQQVCVLFTTGIITSCMVVLYLAWNHISLETTILCYAIRNSKEIAEEAGANEDDSHESNIYVDHFRHVVKHHQMILIYYEKFNSSLKWLTTLVFMDGICLFVSSGLAVLADNFGIKAKLLFFLETQVCVIYAWCWIGQYLNDKGDQILRACADAPWWCMPKPCRSTLLMIMRRCMRPMNLKTALGTIANRASFMDMLTTCYQAVNIIIQTREKIK
ncbi:FACT complex subunit SSRP1 [Nesidiocoris tenuis]|uniref:Odorant receptor n=1 Tax=Nesidiocoris tenuis TaxID=355587 RepID=A0ABN7AMH3_9HEMI|nr:FACT complex subunit SSRP1 [Nesidiocoris tenuis]